MKFGSVKVGISGMAISKPWEWTYRQLQSLHWVKVLLLLENALKIRFLGPLTDWRFEPSPRAHTHSDPIVNKHKEQGKELWMDLSWHSLNSMLQVKTLKGEDLATCGFQKDSRHTHQNPLKLSPVSERSAYLPPAKLRMLFPTHLRVRIYSLWQALHWGLLSKFLAITKNGWGLECLKVNFLEYHGQGTLGCHSFSSLLFGRFSSPTNIPTHSSKLFTLN